MSWGICRTLNYTNIIIILLLRQGGSFNPFDSKSNYGAISNKTTLVHWPLMRGLLHLVQRGVGLGGWGPAQSPPCRNFVKTFDAYKTRMIGLQYDETRGQSNLTKSASRQSRGAHSPGRGHPRGSKVVPLNSWGRVSY